LVGDLEKYELKVSPEKMHDVLYYARLLFCDSQTMATEAGVLGTPAVRCNSFVGVNDMGNFIELENKYGLIYNFSDENKALSCALSLLKTPDIKTEWVKRQKILLNDKIDVTAFMIWFIENYPRSIIEMKEHPEVQYSCLSCLSDAS
jgi:predicted glycosyltransferase